jgi:hypothetical protein
MSYAIFGARVSWPATISNSSSIELITKQNYILEIIKNKMVKEILKPRNNVIACKWHLSYID